MKTITKVFLPNDSSTFLASIPSKCSILNLLMATYSGIFAIVLSFNFPFFTVPAPPSPIYIKKEFSIKFSK